MRIPGPFRLWKVGEQAWPTLVSNSDRSADADIRNLWMYRVQWEKNPQSRHQGNTCFHPAIVTEWNGSWYRKYLIHAEMQDTLFLANIKEFKPSDY
jgi:hypothetical protein